MNLVDSYSITTGFFGKLPKFADFVKLNASGTEISTLDQWLQEGLSIARLKFKNEWRDYYKNTNVINFIYPFTSTEKIIVGILCPSNDNSGRSFPFILYRTLNKEIIKVLPLHLAMLEFNRLFKYFESLFRANYQNENLNEMKSLINSFSKTSLEQTSFENSYRDYLSENTIWNVFSLEIKNTNYLENISLNELFKKNISYLENTAGIRFSFSIGNDNELMKLSFVTELLLNYYWRNVETPAFFWSRRGENNIYLFIYFQKPTPGNFLDLMYSEGQLNQNMSQRTENIFKESARINESTLLKEMLIAIKNEI